MRPLALRPQLTPGLPFSVGLHQRDRAALPAGRARIEELDTCSRNRPDSPGLLRVAEARNDISEDVIRTELRGSGAARRHRDAREHAHVRARGRRRRVDHGRVRGGCRRSRAAQSAARIRPPARPCVRPRPRAGDDGVVRHAVRPGACDAVGLRPPAVRRPARDGSDHRARVAMAISWLPDVKSGDLRPARLLLTPCNSWFAIGPVAVFALAHAEPRHAALWLLFAALAAQFAADFIVSSLRFVVLRGATLSTVLRAAWVYVIDAALSGVAFAIARTSTPPRWLPWRWCRCSVYWRCSPMSATSACRACSSSRAPTAAPRSCSAT